MKRALLALAGFALPAFLSACADGGSVTPTAPSEPPFAQAVAPRPATATGTITMVSSTPGSGAVLQVRECDFGLVTRACADGWRGTFNVSLDRDLRWAVLTIAFYDGATLCGYAADDQPHMAAGQTVSFSPGRISLSDEFGTFSSPCRRPATTTRMVAVLWSDADQTTQLRQEFDSTYNFVEP